MRPGRAAWSEIDQPFMDAAAFALLYFQGADDKQSKGAVMDLVHRAAGELDQNPVDALADLAAAIGRRIRDTSAAAKVVLEFQELGSDEPVDPAVFQTTPSGRAAVWASRLLTASVGADLVTVAALVEVQRTEGAFGLAEGIQALLVGGSAIDYENTMRSTWQDLLAQANTGLPVRYTLDCRAGDWTGSPFHPKDPSYCYRDRFYDRAIRDGLAARHIRDTGHAVAVGEE